MICLTTLSTPQDTQCRHGVSYRGLGMILDCCNPRRLKDSATLIAMALRKPSDVRQNE